MRKFFLTFPILAFLLVLTFSSPLEAKKTKKTKELKKITLAITAIFRNEAPYLKEWIEFHRLMGVEKFYLYNNLSNDEFKEVLKPYIKKGLVDLTNWNYAYEDISRWSPIQCSAYMDAIKRSKGLVTWLAVLDTDEFLFPTKHDNLKDFLASYNDCASIGVNWQLYGTSNLANIPSNKLMIESLVWKAETDYIENRHIKSIVRPECVDSPANPHNFNLLLDTSQVNTKKIAFEGPTTPYVDIEDARINHYWTRDEHYFNNFKLKRRQGWSEGIEHIIQRKNNLSAVEDTAILRFVPKLKKQMSSKARR